MKTNVRSCVLSQPVLSPREASNSELHVPCAILMFCPYRIQRARHDFQSIYSNQMSMLKSVRRDDSDMASTKKTSIMTEPPN